MNQHHQEIVKVLRAEGRPDLAVAFARQVGAGWSYATEYLYLSFQQLPGRLRPFNIDTIQAIHNIWVEVKSDDGEGSVAPKVTGHRGSEPLTYPQEKAGKRREEIVTLQVPKGHTKTFTAAIQRALGRDFKITALSRPREPETVGSVVKAQGPFPTLQNEAASRKKASAEIHKLITNKYFDSIPVNEISDILERHGFSAHELEGVYTGREGRARNQVGPKTWVVLNWYKMPESGRYEITCYLS